MKTLYQKLPTFGRIMYFLFVTCLVGYSFSWVTDWLNMKSTGFNILGLFVGVALIHFYVKFLFFCCEAALHRAWDKHWKGDSK